MKSLTAFWLSSLTILGFAFFFVPRWQMAGGHSTFSWDVGGYYWYLPSTFIYHDLKEQKLGDSLMAVHQFSPTFQQGVRLADGNYVLTYSSGMAVLYSPFFFIAHLIAKPLGYAADGFSLPYKAAISWASLLVAVASLWLYRRFLKYYFKDSIVAIVLLLLAIGSNYLNYTAIEGAQTHNWLFLLYVIILLQTRKFYGKPTYAVAIGIGLACGMAILVRPTEVICVLIPLLWGMETLKISALREKFLFFWKYKLKLAIAILFTILPGLLQLFYWKYSSGHWLYYSYAEKTFSWLSPHFKDYILSYRSGWLTYTPLVLFLFVGFIPFLKLGFNKVMVVCYSLLSIYIVSSWDIWWYGGTGGRAMIQSYPILFLPLAYLIQWLSKRRILAIISVPFFTICVYFNIWFTVQAHGGASLYDAESMNRAYYWKIVGRWSAPKNYLKYKDTDETYEGPPQLKKILLVEDFENDSIAINALRPIAGRRSLHLDSEQPNSATFQVAIPRKAKWINVSATFRTDAKEWTPWRMTQIIVKLKNKGIQEKERFIRVQRYLQNWEVKVVDFDIKIPNQSVDTAAIFIWLGDSPHPITIDDLTVSYF